MPVRIGELLLKEKRITPEQLQQALNFQKSGGGKLGFNLVKMGFIKDEEITSLLEQAVRRPVDQSHAVRDRRRRHQADPARDRAEVPDRSAQPRWRDADDRDDGSDQRLRDGRHQVHDRLQRRAGRRLGDRRRRRDHQVLPGGGVDTRSGRHASAQGEARADAADPAERSEHARDGEPRPRRVAGDARGRDRRRSPRRAPGNQRRRPRQAGRGSAGRPSRERRADVGHSEGGERHPHRTVREGTAGPLPHRRHSLQHHEPADEVPRCDRLAHQDHVEARHRREAAAAGRPHQDPVQRRRRAEGNRLPRLSAADALRREDRPASARQGQVDARHDAARVRAGVADQVRAGDSAAVGHGAGHRTDRVGQDEHACIRRSPRSTPPRPTS